jgi:hypothetical protein
MKDRRALRGVWRIALATWAGLSVIHAAGCAWLSGLEDLQKVPCLPGHCGSGDSGLDAPAALDDASDTSTEPETESGEAGDANSDVGGDVGVAETGDDGSAEGDAGSDSGDAGSGEVGGDATTGDASSDGAGDAAPDAPPRTCGSSPLKPKAAVALSVRLTSVAANAIDGVLSTRWESEQGIDPEWIYADFGAPVYINEVQILWELSCAANYQLQVSNDGGSWTTVRSVTGNNVNAGQFSNPPTDWTRAVISTGLSKAARYLRVYGTARCGPYGYSMFEMRFFGDANAACTP